MYPRPERNHFKFPGWGTKSLYTGSRTLLSSYNIAVSGTWRIRRSPLQQDCSIHCLSINIFYSWFMYLSHWDQQVQPWHGLGRDKYDFYFRAPVLKIFEGLRTSDWWEALVGMTKALCKPQGNFFWCGAPLITNFFAGGFGFFFYIFIFNSAKGIGSALFFVILVVIFFWGSAIFQIEFG